MLVITRKPDQSIVIGGEVEVIVLGITKDGVRLGIKAPRTVQVHRREVPVQDVAALLRAAQVRKPHIR